jgi:hypothetical protein
MHPPACGVLARAFGPKQRPDAQAARVLVKVSSEPAAPSLTPWRGLCASEATNFVDGLVRHVVVGLGEAVAVGLVLFVVADLGVAVVVGLVLRVVVGLGEVVAVGLVLRVVADVGDLGVPCTSVSVVAKDARVARAGRRRSGALWPLAAHWSWLHCSFAQ